MLLRRLVPAAALLPLIAFGAAPVVAAPENGVVINEVESNGDPVGDWVELANTDPDHDVDVSGWSLIDNDDSHTPVTLPEGTSIESGGYLVVYTEEHFGLGGNDSVTVFDATGSQVDHTSWDSHALHTWGRLPDMTGDFGETGEPTRGLPNIADNAEPAPADRPWPFDPLTITDVDLGPDFTQEDYSGIDFDSDGTAWVVNNGQGTLHRLAYAEGNYTETGQWRLRYPDGAGTPDAEGVTVDDHGVIYVATERNNDERGTSLPAILAFHPTEDTRGADLSAEKMWDLSEHTGTIGANAGPEAISWLPDAFGGSFAVAIEATGEILFITLDQGGADSTLQQRYDSPFAGLMALDYHQGTLTALCDEVCEGRSIELHFDGARFIPGETAHRPAEMANFANEGCARYTDTEQCAGGGQHTTERMLWADDAATDGTALRAATRSGECEESTVAGSTLGSTQEANLTSSRG